MGGIDLYDRECTGDFSVAAYYDCYLHTIDDLYGANYLFTLDLFSG